MPNIWVMDLGRYLKLKEIFESESFEKTSIAILLLIYSDKNKGKTSALNVLDVRYY